MCFVPGVRFHLLRMIIKFSFKFQNFFTFAKTLRRSIMKQKLSIISGLLIPALSFSQKTEPRENIILKGFDYGIYMQNKKDNTTDKEIYLIPNKGDTIRENAIVKNTAGEETHRGIYRKNETEIHFVDIDLKAEKFNHKVYSPNKKGVLKLIKENRDLNSYPPELPPKFKDNKPPHPEFAGGETELYQWIEKNLYPIIDQKHKKKENGNAVLVLDIDSKGVPSFIQIRNLNISQETQTKLSDKIKTSPVWKTKLQGYEVSGLVFIPIEY